MRIEYKCSGGFGGLQLAYQGETDELPSEQAQELSDLVEASGIFELTPKQLSKKPPGIPDDFSCQLTVLKAGKRKTLSFNELGAPATLRRLSVRLRKLAIQKRGR
jgi:Emfourin